MEFMEQQKTKRKLINILHRNALKNHVKIVFTEATSLHTMLGVF